jgi:hypothetical protein
MYKRRVLQKTLSCTLISRTPLVCITNVSYLLSDQNTTDQDDNEIERVAAQIEKQDLEKEKNLLSEKVEEARNRPAPGTHIRTHTHSLSLSLSLTHTHTHTHTHTQHTQTHTRIFALISQIRRVGRRGLRRWRRWAVSYKCM